MSSVKPETEKEEGNEQTQEVAIDSPNPISWKEKGKQKTLASILSKKDKKKSSSKNGLKTALNPEAERLKKTLQWLIGHNFRSSKIIEEFLKLHANEWIYENGYIPPVKREHIIDVFISKPVVSSKGESKPVILNFISLETIFDDDNAKNSGARVFPTTPMNAVSIPQLIEIREFLTENIRYLGKQLHDLNKGLLSIKTFTNVVKKDTNN